MNHKIIGISVSLVILFAAICGLYACPSCQFPSPTPMTAKDHAITEVVAATKRYNDAVEKYIESKSRLNNQAIEEIDAARKRAADRLEDARSAAKAELLSVASAKLREFAEEISIVENGVKR